MFHEKRGKNKLEMCWGAFSGRPKHGTWVKTLEKVKNKRDSREKRCTGESPSGGRGGASPG